jgi:gamma-glutamylcyclotransferase (GGCT)/AIG2-like uncharacterized protein YtfP
MGGFNYESDSDSDFDIISESRKRTVFLSGTFLAKYLLALILTGDRENTTELMPELTEAVVRNFRRGKVQNKDYPALVRAGPESIVEGHFFHPRNRDDRRKIDDFEDGQYAREIVIATIESGEEVEVTTYVWNGGRDAMSLVVWDQQGRETATLPDWLDSFEGMDLYI